MAENEFAPCRLDDIENGLYSLSFDEFDLAADVFEAAGWDGGGYGWHGVVDALVRMQAPALESQIDYDPEASLFVALSQNRDALVQVAGLMRDALAAPKLLQEAIANADPELMD